MISAILRRNLFEPLLARGSGVPKLRYWKELEKTQFYSQQRLEEIQWRRLKKLWNFLWENNEFYRKRFEEEGLTEKSLGSPSDLAKLPILTKEQIRLNTDKMISKGVRKEKLIHFRTGGSTGKALDVFVTLQCSNMRNACTLRHDRWAGWELGEPIGAVWGNPKLPFTLKERIFDIFIQPRIYLDTMSVTKEAVLKFARAWRRKKPTLLFGHAHSLFLLAGMVEKLGVDTIRPKGIISSSMMLLDHERAVIERVFRVRVTDRYGCEEVSLIASECQKHDGLHLNIEHLFIEFIKDDGAPAGPGEYGRIIVTDLMNYAMPFVRYQVEDMGIPTNRICSCGRGLPLMERVVGRTADFLIKEDGTKVAGISLIENTLTKYPGIDQMQVIQESIGKIKVNLVPGQGYSNEVKLALNTYFKQVFGQSTRVFIQQVSGIKPEKSGKYRFSICRVQ